MKVQYIAVLEEYEKLNKKLSNPGELIEFACNLSAKLSEIWRSSNYYKKLMFQYTLFPNGLAFDSKTNDYRTPVVNSVISLNAE